MAKQKNTKRVVLNLTQDQAIELNQFLLSHVEAFANGSTSAFQKIPTLRIRLERTIKRNAVIEEYRNKYNEEPTAEQIKKMMEVSA